MGDEKDETTVDTNAGPDAVSGTVAEADVADDAVQAPASEAGNTQETGGK